MLDELSDWLSEKKVPWSQERRSLLLDGLVVPRDDPVVKDELNLSQFIRLHKATELGMMPKELQHDIAVTEGRLQIRMHWRPKHPTMMQIDVTVIECEGLTQMDRFLCFTGQNDPYVRVTVSGVNKQTDAIPGGGSNPRWNENPEDQLGSLLQYEVHQLPDHIWLRVFDEDEASADDLIGIGKIDLSEQPCDTKWFWTDWVEVYETYGAEDGKKGKQSGRVKVKLHFDPAGISHDKPSASRASRSDTGTNLNRQISRQSSQDEDQQVGRFEFTIKAGKNLTAQDAFGDNDVYVATTIGVGKSDMLRDAAGNRLNITSNLVQCPTPLDATRIAEGSDYEDEVADP